MKDKRYTDANNAMKAKQKSGNLKDEYTGKTIKINEKANLDHVIPRKQIFEKPWRKIADIDTADLANKKENLAATNESLNKSKGAKSGGSSVNMGAGGIGDGRGMAAALMLGADAVQLGTRFLVATECTAHDNFKASVLKAKDIDTVITGQITGHPVRVLRNKLTKLYLQAEKEETGKENPDFERLEDIGRGALRRIVVEGDTQMGSMMAGQIAGLISKEQSCSEIIKELMAESHEVIQKQLARF